jgi:hypothetical protein
LIPALPVLVAEATALEAAEIRSEADLETEAAPLSAEDLAEATSDEAADAAEVKEAEAALAPLKVSFDPLLLMFGVKATYEARAEVPEAMAEEASDTAPERLSEAEAITPEAPSETDEAADLVDKL